MTTTTDTTSAADSTAGVAADESRRVGHVAAGEVKNVAGEAAAQVRGLADEARSQIEEQGRSQRDYAISTLTSFSDDLDAMRHGESPGQGLAGDVVRMVSERARDLSQRLEGREPRELLADVRSFARRKPGTFLLGSLAAGVVAGRLLRGAKDADGSASSVAATRTSADTFAPSVRGTEQTGLSTSTVDEPQFPASDTRVIGDEIGVEPTGTVEPGAHRGAR